MSGGVALVTGASRGIGKAIALELSSTHTIIAGARTAEALAPLRSQLPDLVPFVCDLGSEAQTAAAVAELGLTELDVLVNSAGVADERPFDTFTREDWRKQFEVNVFAVADLTARLLPALRAARGTIVMLNSGSGLFSYAGGSVYTGTKFALRTMADCLREEERTNGVRVTSVHPGYVDTDMGRGVIERKGPGQTFVQPRTIASAVRLAVDAPPEAQVEMLSIRPSRGTVL
ncbi:SDR family oxidoreductase [Gryllotalpicola ginsengisoli]|uniref:SDR family oxidoreductase n=1 Tax=Gryllotalpicola ginsengisoli TaxID=444608 RepID=UPI0003B46E08|nr:SDR family oxidoreductase [Gryllotalpicola ginsengisoli]